MRSRRYSIEVTALRLLRPLGLAFFVVISLFPFLYMVLLSMRDISEVAQAPGRLLPEVVTLDAFSRVLRAVDDGGRGSCAFS
jgi:multiple sugar transport system permease protein